MHVSIGSRWLSVSANGILEKLQGCQSPGGTGRLFTVTVDFQMTKIRSLGKNGGFGEWTVQHYYNLPSSLTYPNDSQLDVVVTSGGL